MLGRFLKLAEMMRLKGSPEEEITREVTNLKNEAIEKSARLKKLQLSPESGWKDFSVLVRDYLKAIKKRKATTNLHKANEETLQLIKDIDHEVYIIEWVLRIPQQYIKQVDQMIEKDQKNG